MKRPKTLKDISSGTDYDFIERIKERNANRKQIRTNVRIALDILIRLDELGMTQKELAEKLEVTPQYISSLIRGKKNFNSEILVKIEELLDMPIFVQNLSREKQELLKIRQQAVTQYKKELATPGDELFQEAEVFAALNRRAKESKIMEYTFSLESLKNPTVLC